MFTQLIMENKKEMGSGLKKKRWGQVSTFDIGSRIEMNFCHENTTKVEDIQLQLLIKRSGFKAD